MPYSLVWLRHHAEQICQLHCLGTILENGFHPAGLVHKSELAKHRVTVAAAQQCAPKVGFPHTRARETSSHPDVSLGLRGA